MEALLPSFRSPKLGIKLAKRTSLTLLATALTCTSCGDPDWATHDEQRAARIHQTVTGPAGAASRAAVVNGDPVEVCGWPTTVSLGGCTGTLIHPEVVISAAHCGDGERTASFGETASNPARRVSATCTTFPGYEGSGSGTDFAFCKLSEPVTDIPIVPPLMGCETDVLKPDQDVVLAGFGLDENQRSGTKRHLTTQLQRVTDGNEALAGGDGFGTCQGDSGGPVYVRLPDMTWRVFGITTYGATGMCGGGGFYSMMHVGMEWFEETAGVDLTPCHDADGTWNPGPDCGRFPTDPAPGGGSWQDGCEFGPVAAEPSSTCGDALAPADTEPPVLSINAPADGTVLEVENDQAMAQVDIVVSADDGAGSGIKEVHVFANGQAVPGVPDTAPFELQLSLPVGSHMLTATGSDLADNSADAEPVSLTVSVSAPEPPPTVDPPSGGAPEDPTPDGTLPMAPAPPPNGSAPEPPASGAPGRVPDSSDDGGCGCRVVQQRSSGSLWGLLLALGLGVRRRRLRGVGSGLRGAPSPVHPRPMD